jgi:hypothetical protein
VYCTPLCVVLHYVYPIVCCTLLCVSHCLLFSIYALLCIELRIRIPQELPLMYSTLICIALVLHLVIHCHVLWVVRC